MFHRPLLDVPDPFPSFCSTPPPSTPNSLLMTGIRRPPCATPPEGLLFGHLAESTPLPGYEPKTCVDVSSEHAPNSDGFHQQAEASGGPQQVPASVVNPWLSADMWSCTRKLLRGNESISSVEGTLSRGKRDRDLDSVQTLSEKRNLHVYLENAELAARQ